MRVCVTVLQLSFIAVRIIYFTRNLALCCAYFKDSVVLILRILLCLFSLRNPP